MTSQPSTARPDTAASAVPGAPHAAVTDETWDTAVLAAAGAVVVVFMSRTSTPCHAFGRVLDRVAEQLPGTVRVVRLDVENCPLTARRYDVSSLPTVLVLRDGFVRTRLVGTRASERLHQELAAQLR